MKVNPRVIVVREAITRIVPILVGRGIKVTQAGSKAYVVWNKAGGVVRVNLPYLPDDSDNELITAVQGFLDHEVAHILFTDPKAVHEATALKINGLHNRLEDPFIEKQMAARFTGSGYNMRITGELYLKDHVEPHLAGRPDAHLNLLLVPAIRAWAGQELYEKFMEDKWGLIEDFTKTVGADLIAKIPLAASSWDNLDIAKEMHRRLKEADKREKKPEEKSKTKPEYGDDDGDARGDDAPPASDEDLSWDDKEEEAGGKGKAEGDSGEDSGEDGEGTPGEDDGDDADDKPAGDDGDSPTDDADASDESDGPEKADGDKPGEDEAGDDDLAGGTDDAEPGEVEDDSSDEKDGKESDSGDDVGEDAGDAGDNTGGSSDEDETGSGDDDAVKSPGGGDPDDDGVKGMGEEEFDRIMKDADDFDEGVAKTISERMLDSDSPYLIYTQDHDKVETFEAEDLDPSYVTALENTVDHMIAPMQKDLERAIAARSAAVWTGGHKSGRLHGAALVRLVTDRVDVFRRKQENTSKSVAVTLVNDFSGSMTDSGKYRLAAQASYGLSATLERLGINHEVIGFTTRAMPYTAVQEARNDPNINKFARLEALYMPIVKEFHERLTVNVKRRFAAVANELQSFSMEQNVDGECVQIAAHRLAVRPEHRKIMIVLSDGMPACGYSTGAVLGNHLKEIVKGIERSGIDVVGIGINTTAVKQFYPKNVVITGISQLPVEVMRQLKALLLK